MKLDKSLKLKGIFKTKGIGVIIIGILAGIALLLFPSGEKASEVPENKVLTSAEYCLLLEQKAEKLLCELPEIKNCSVFITLERGYRYVYATDQRVRESENGKETEKTVVLATNGSGEQAILVEESMPTVAGVAVVCPNASYETQYRIIELMCALFDIKSNRISVKS